MSCLMKRASKDLRFWKFMYHRWWFRVRLLFTEPGLLSRNSCLHDSRSTDKELWERNWHLFIWPPCLVHQYTRAFISSTCSNFYRSTHSSTSTTWWGSMTSRSFLLPVQEAGRSHPLVTLKECLADNPESRPKASELVSQLRIMSPELPPPPPFTPFQESSIIKFSLKSIQP